MERQKLMRITERSDRMYLQENDRKQIRKNFVLFTNPLVMYVAQQTYSQGHTQCMIDPGKPCFRVRTKSFVAATLQATLASRTIHMGHGSHPHNREGSTCGPHIWGLGSAGQLEERKVLMHECITTFRVAKREVCHFCLF